MPQTTTTKQKIFLRLLASAGQPTLTPGITLGVILTQYRLGEYVSFVDSS